MGGAKSGDGADRARCENGEFEGCEKDVGKRPSIVPGVRMRANPVAPVLPSLAYVLTGDAGRGSLASCSCSNCYFLRPIAAQTLSTLSGFFAAASSSVSKLWMAPEPSGRMA